MRAGVIDLRSDTVTQPTTAMRKAMARAELGDDAYREDPTALRLEELFADLVGKEAAIFVASGTMGNLASLMAARPPPGTVVADRRSHLIAAEGQSLERVARLAAVALDLDGDRVADIQKLESALAPVPPGRGVISIENTQVLHAGQALREEYGTHVATIAAAVGCWMHLDGARLFNAAVRLGVPVAVLARPFDSVTVCLSKGLSCPAGSLVAGNRRFIENVRGIRRILGGSMRQVGVLAAAGLVALADGSAGTVNRLAIDHAMAETLSDGLADVPNVSVHPPAGPATNIVVFSIRSNGSACTLDQRDQFVRLCEQRGVRFGSYRDGRLRAVTHRGIEPPDIAVALSTVHAVVGEIR